MPKNGAWTACRFKGWLGKKEGVVFLRGVGFDSLMYTMMSPQIFAAERLAITLTFLASVKSQHLLAFLFHVER